MPIYKDVESAMAPAQQALAVTPNDSADLPGGVARALYIGGAGNLVVLPPGNAASVTIAVQAGLLPLAVKRVLATNTTATGIVALY